MLNKLKETALKDWLLTALVIYCSGWVTLIIYVIIDSFFNADGVSKNRLTGEMITNPGLVLEQLVIFGIIIFPLMALLGLISIKISINKLDKQMSKNYAR